MNVSATSAVNSAVLAQAARPQQPAEPPVKSETSHASGETSHNSKRTDGIDIKV